MTTQEPSPAGTADTCPVPQRWQAIRQHSQAGQLSSFVRAFAVASNSRGQASMKGAKDKAPTNRCPRPSPTPSGSVAARPTYEGRGGRGSTAIGGDSQSRAKPCGPYELAVRRTPTRMCTTTSRVPLAFRPLPACLSRVRDTDGCGHPQSGADMSAQFFLDIPDNTADNIPRLLRGHGSAGKRPRPAPPRAARRAPTTPSLRRHDTTWLAPRRPPSARERHNLSSPPYIDPKTTQNHQIATSLPGDPNDKQELHHQNNEPRRS